MGFTLVDIHDLLVCVSIGVLVIAISTLAYRLLVSYNTFVNRFTQIKKVGGPVAFMQRSIIFAGLFLQH